MQSSRAEPENIVHTLPARMIHLTLHTHMLHAQTQVRRNVLDLTDAELRRFLDAVREMMKPIDGKPETGEYFRLAGYHGWPEDYCTWCSIVLFSNLTREF